MMTRLLVGFVAAMPSLALAQVSTAGDIVVIQDPSNAITSLVSADNMAIFPSHQEQFCRAAYNAMRKVLPDQYDGIISFSAADGVISDLENVFQGSVVRSDASGIGRANAAWANTYNGQKMSQCVFMGTLARTTSFIPGLPGSEPLPPNPDDDWSISLGIPGPKSLTGIEIMGHEYGHHWLLGVEFDQGLGAGKQHFIRAFSEGTSGEGESKGYPNQHYSRLADSRSVMYGECITDLGGGSYRLSGCARSYSQIDQYLMGLRLPNEVAPMLVLEDPASPGQGVDSIAFNRSGSTTVNGYVAHHVSVDDIVRAMGPRVPSALTASHCFRVAFVVVLPQGMTTIPSAVLQKVERYRARWGPWFSGATDARGTMDTTVIGPSTCPGAPPWDGGVSFDAGVDAGVEPVDAGPESVDAGEVGEVADAGQPQQGDAGVTVAPELTKLRPGCGCQGSGELQALFALAAWVVRRRR